MPTARARTARLWALALLAASILGWAGLQSCRPPSLAALGPLARASTTSGLQGIDADIDDRVRRGRYPGAVFAIARGDRVLHAGAIGLADPERNVPMRLDSVFRTMSMTKAVTTVAAMVLVDRGKLDLDEPVGRYLPELGDYGSVDGAILTTRHLLLHTGGQGFGTLVEGPTTLQARVAELVHDGLDNKPGEKWRYTAYDGFDLIARLVEVVSGVPYAQFVKTQIFDPLGMKDTTYVLDADQQQRLVELHAARWGTIYKARPFLLEADTLYPSGGAGLYSTALDWIRFAQMLAGSGALGSVRLLEQETVAEIAREHLPAGFPGVPTQFSWALGMRRVSEEVQAFSPLPVGSYGWSGAFGTHFWVSPKEGLAAVFMINLTNAGGAGSEDAFDFERIAMDACRSDPRCSG